MAIYVWQGKDPDPIYVVNRRDVRVASREDYQERAAPSPPLLKWRGKWSTATLFEQVSDLWRP